MPRREVATPYSILRPAVLPSPQPQASGEEPSARLLTFETSPDCSHEDHARRGSQSGSHSARATHPSRFKAASLSRRTAATPAGIPHSHTHTLTPSDVEALNAAPVAAPPIAAVSSSESAAVPPSAEKRERAPKPRLAGSEYGTCLAMQRTLLAYVRTAISIVGIGRSSSLPAVQYATMAAGLICLLSGLYQHTQFGSEMFQTDVAGRESRIARAFFTQGCYFHWVVLLVAITAAGAAGLASFGPGHLEWWEAWWFATDLAS